MAGEKLLSESRCKHAKPRPKMYYLNDGGGFGCDAAQTAAKPDVSLLF